MRQTRYLYDACPFKIHCCHANIKCVIFHRFNRLCVAMTHWECLLGVPIFWSPCRITPIYWLMAQMPSSTFLHRHWANALSAPQISLPSRSGHISPSVQFFLARYSDSFFAEILHLHFGDCNCGMFSSRWSAWIFVAASRCVLASIVSDDPHVSVLTLCLGFHTCAMRFTALLNV